MSDTYLFLSPGLDVALVIGLTLLGLTSLLILFLTDCNLYSVTGHYYIRPDEMADAKKHCEEYGGLTGLTVTVSGNGSKLRVVFHAVCNDGQKLTWEKTRL